MDKHLVTDQFVAETMWRRWGLTPKRKGREWHSPCPLCGGTDRFWVTEIGHFQCRQCAFGGWLDDDKPMTLDPAKLAELKQKAIDAEIARQKDIARRLKELRTENAHAAYRQGRDDEAAWHAKVYFNSQGIDDRLIQMYELGYVSDHIVKTDAEYLHLGAYTIPIKDPVTCELVNMQYRIENPPEGVGKYQQVYGLNAASFFAEPMPEGVRDRKTIVCEGAKKAIVTYDRIDAKMQVVGLPGCSPGENLLNQLKDLESLWLILDPGCQTQVARIKRFLPQARVVELPDKVDDAWLAGMTESQFKSYLLQARK